MKPTTAFLFSGLTIPNISIIICTRNRAGTLRPTLESIGKATVPQGCTIELLVVDNGSSDHTEQVVRCTSFPQMTVRYIKEPRIGKSYAYNTGLSTATGEILLWTDDDVRVPTCWIEGICQPILEGNADAVAGGVVLPPHIDPLSKEYLLKNRHGWVTSTHRLDPRRPGQMFGANMAFHRRVLDKVSRFDIELGPGPGGLGNCEDSLFSLQILAAGFKLVGALDVAVEHHFDLTLLNREVLMDAARKMGRSHAYIFHHWEHKKSRLAVPRLILCHLRRYWARCIDRHRNKTDRNISDQDLRLEQELAFYREYIVQRRRGFKYSLRGLAPLGPEINT
jgi:glycosyltransferase involved in cell wall biosynthesis